MWKVWGLVAVVVALATQGAPAFAAEAGGKVQGASGTVVAVVEGSKTIVIESTLGGQSWIVGAEVTDSTKFGGKATGLKDLKPGNKVTMQWVRQEHGDIAQSITLR